MPSRRPEPGPTAASVLTDALRARILDGRLAPGEQLRQEELAEAFAVSRHTLRSGLAALTAERLVVAEPYRGARVAALDDDALVALQQLRCALETEAVRLLGEAHGRDWPAAALAAVDAALAALEQAEREGDWPGTARAHAGVHRALVDAAGSPRISEVCAGLDTELLLLLRGVRPHYGTGDLAAEHRAYVEELRAGDVDAVRRHLTRSTALILAGRASQQ